MPKRKRTGLQGGGGHVKKSLAEAQEIKQLQSRIQEGAPPPKTNVLSAGDRAPTNGTSWATAKRFEELPISQYTKDQLKSHGFEHLTAIQRAALPHALAGRDVLGAAKTGSGKTLAFLIPVLELLYRLQWSRLDGLGALVITPTRELALQIFEELRKVGKRHELSAGLLVGGKKVKQEQQAVHGMNILVCTPGRLLQHMDETPGFDASQLQALVLDEADRILDMGFSASVNAILDFLPRQRQTMLFSATQTKSVKDLARLSLADPEYISAHAEAAAPTPLKLQQAYMVCTLPDKLNLLWSFIKTHLDAKVVVFLSTCKQVKFVYEAFRKLRPGVPLRCLHGKMKQMKRMAVFYDFCQGRTGSVLFATDIAARGLDFPTVNWVVQVDCPEDVDAYIHRVGRTARYVSEGKALMFLLPSEQEAMLRRLAAKNIPINGIKANPSKTQEITGSLQALLSKTPELKELAQRVSITSSLGLLQSEYNHDLRSNPLQELAQRALVAYLRSVFLQPDRAVFDVTQLPASEYALSLGLSTAPKLRFLRKAGRKVHEVTVGGGSPLQENVPEEQEQPQLEACQSGFRLQEPSTAAAAGQAVQPQTPAVRASGHGDVADTPAGSDSEDDLLTVKRRDVLRVAPAARPSEGGPSDQLEGVLMDRVQLRGRKRAKLRIDPHRTAGGKVVFDEEGAAMQPLELLAQDELGREDVSDETMRSLGLDAGSALSAAQRFKQVAAELKRRDRRDRQEQQELRRQARQLKRAKRLAREAETGAAAPKAVLAGAAPDSVSEPGSDDELPAGSFSASDGNSAGEQYEGGLSSDEEGPQAAPGRPEVAHAGMQRRAPLDVAGAGTLSLAEQEALALRLMGGS